MKKVFAIIAGVLMIVILSVALYYFLINRNPNLKAVYLDVTYKVAGDQELKLDIYMPERQFKTKIPMMVFFHGGGWNGGNKELGESDHETFDIFRKLGFAIVSVEYRLTNEQITFPIPFADASDSIRWLHLNASQYGLDNKKINLIGTSAGGQMALLEGLIGNQFKDDANLADITFRINSIVSLCGPTDLTDLSGFDDFARGEAANVLSRMIGGSYGEMPEQYMMASPINHINKNSPPIIISHGTLDDKVPYHQAEKFYEAAQKAGARVTFIPVKNADHKFKAPKGEKTDPPVNVALQKIALFLLKRNLI